MTETEAKQQITKVLQELEQSTGRKVEHLGLSTTDVSTMAESKELISVDLQLERVAGRDWSS
ncbi:MAG: hypothetical protein AAF662_08290 [Pseudomonadota bacterium]